VRRRAAAREITVVPYGTGLPMLCGSVSVRRMFETDARVTLNPNVVRRHSAATENSCAATAMSEGAFIAAADRRQWNPSGSRAVAGFHRPVPAVVPSAGASAVSPTGKVKRSRPGISPDCPHAAKGLRVRTVNTIRRIELS
jgi:hypothetical protein